MVDMLPAADAEPLPDDIAALYSDTNVYSYKMVMGHIFLGDGDPIEGDMSEWSLPELYELFGPQTVNPSSTIFTDNPDFYHINGQFQPTVVLASGNVGLFRMVHAGTTRALVLKFAVPNVCEMRLLARDGVFQQNGYVRVTRMVFFCGTRADFAILCKPPAATVYPLDIAVYADNQDIGPLVGNVHQQDVMFTVRIVSPEESQQVPPITVFPTSPVPLPSYMSDLTHAPVDWARIVDLDSDKINGVYFPGYNADPSIR